MPDEAEIGGYTGADRDAHPIGILVGAVIFITFFIAVYFWVGRLESDQRGFMSSCIEFHSVQRCKELDFYNRRDLARSTRQ